MNALDVLEELGEMASVLRENMTIEEAVDIIDPENQTKPEYIAKLPDSRAKCQALMIKANIIVVNYVRNHLAKEKELRECKVCH